MHIRPRWFTSWSFSRWLDWVTCPLRAKLKHVERRPEPGSDALARGAAIHTKLSQFLNDPRIDHIPEEAQVYEEFLVDIKQLRREKPDQVNVEGDWAFTKAWEPSTWDDWDRTWVRIKLDVSYLSDGELVVVDWKTGRFRASKHEEYTQQLELYALAGLIRHPKVTQVSPLLVYLDEAQTHEVGSFTKRDLPRLKKLWEGRVKPMLADRLFPAVPGDHCRWCHFSKSRGGPCKY